MIKQLWNGMLISLAMYSKIPVPHVEWTDEDMEYSMCFFPLVGVVIGALMLGWHFLSRYLGFGNAFVTAVYLVIPVIITGGIHLDGLLDTADAISSWQTRERRLEILKDSNSGAFAVITCACYFVLAYGVWTQMNLDCLKVLAVGYVLSRSLSGLSVVSFKKARKNGMAVAFSNPAQKKIVQVTMVILIVICAVMMCALNLPLGITAFAAALLVFAYYHHMAYKNFGGTTGDLCGFFLQICELTMALAVVVAVVLISNC